jgi:hypothetical protein
MGGLGLWRMPRNSLRSGSSSNGPASFGNSGMTQGDSMLVVKQINREWKTKNAALRSLRTQAEELLALFESSRVEWNPRRENRRTDKLGRAR